MITTRKVSIYLTKGQFKIIKSLMKSGKYKSISQAVRIIVDKNLSRMK